MPPPPTVRLHLPTDQFHIRIFRCDWHDIDASWDSANVCSPYWRLYINNRDGASVVLKDRTEYALPARRVHFIPAGVHFTCRCRRSVEHFYVHFDVIGFSSRAMQRHFGTPRTLARQPLLLGLRDDLLLLRRDANLPLLCRVKALVYLSLARLLESLPADDNGLADLLRDDGPVAPAVRFIENHLSEPLDTWTLAEMCHLSRDHFIRTFHQHVGRTPAQYIIDRRVTLAAEQLLFTSDSIDAIAARTGFPDRFYFSRVFARKMGAAPAGFRKSKPV